MERFLNTSDDIPGKCVAEMYTLAFFPQGVKTYKVFSESQSCKGQKPFDWKWFQEAPNALGKSKKIVLKSFQAQQSSPCTQNVTLSTVSWVHIFGLKPVF